VNLMIGSKKENIGLIATKCRRFVKHLEAKNNILLLTTSTRCKEHPWDIPKTTQLALRIEKHLKQKGKHVAVIDVANLRIHTCEGNISAQRGNNCGVLEAKLRDKQKNPTGQHRRWASLNNKDDQLYKIRRELFKSQAVVFFVSVRWGQTNSVYQRLFERLSWIENRVTSLGEKPIPQLKKLEASIVLFGHNWNDEQAVTELELFAFANLSRDEESLIEDLLTTVSVVPVDSRIARLAALMRRHYRVQSPGQHYPCDGDIYRQHTTHPLYAGLPKDIEPCDTQDLTPTTSYRQRWSKSHPAALP